jgi:hypothetical protein
MLMGYSGSSANSFVSAYYSWLFSGISTSTRPMLIKAGTLNFPHNRWGDYSYTCVDPADDWNIWTVQEYTFQTQQFNYPWATWIMQVDRNH